jgi:hypothetical protein
MRKGFLSALTAILTGAGVALAQTPGSPSAPEAQTAAAPTPKPLTLAQATTPAEPSRPGPDSGPTAPDAAGTTGRASDTAAGTKIPKEIVQIQIMSGQFYGTADYIYWWAKGHRVPPLVTTGPVVTPASPAAAALGQPGTVVLFGGSDLDNEARSGARFTAGYWFDPAQTLGVEAGAFFLSQKGSNFTARSDGTAILARPFLNPQLSTDPAQQETSFLIAGPAVASGAVRAASNNDVWGAEANARWFATGSPCYRADILAGFRYLRVKDDLAISSDSTVLPNGVLPLPTQPQTIVNRLAVNDTFRTRNDFYGGQLGARLEVRRGPWYADFAAKLALGVMHQLVDVSGTTAVTAAGAATPTVSAGGLFAQPGINLGQHTRDEFGIVPEVGFNVGYQFRDHVRTHIGYSIIYWRTDVVRPGTQIDRVVQPPGTTAAFNFKDQDFWVQGINAGVEFGF